MLDNGKYCLGTSFLHSLNNRPNVCSILSVKKGIILSSSGKNCFILGFISVKKTKIGFMSVDIRTASAKYLKGFLKKIKIPSLPVVFFPLMLPPTDNFLTSSPLNF